MKLHWLQFAHEGPAESNQSLTVQARFTLPLRKKKNSNIEKLKFTVFSFWILVTNNDAHEWLTLCFRKTVPGDRDFIYLKVSLPLFEIQPSSGSLHLSPPPSKTGVFFTIFRSFSLMPGKHQIPYWLKMSVRFQ